MCCSYAGIRTVCGGKAGKVKQALLQGDKRCCVLLRLLLLKGQWYGM